MSYTAKSFKEKLAKLKAIYQVTVFSDSLKKKLGKLHNELDQFQDKLAKETNIVLREMEMNYMDKEIKLIEDENKKPKIK